MSDLKQRLHSLINKKLMTEFENVYKSSDLSDSEDSELIDTLFIQNNESVQNVFCLSKNKNKKKFIEIMYITLIYLIRKNISLNESNIYFLISSLPIIKLEYEKIIIDLIIRDKMENNIFDILIVNYKKEFNEKDILKILEGRKVKKEIQDKANLYFEMINF